MMQNSSEGDGSNAPLLDRFFCGLAEYIFHSKLGVADSELVNYVSDLLVRFTKTDTMLRIRQVDGRPASEVITMMSEAQTRVGVAKREVHRHIGDFTLFWTGIYPESLRESTHKLRSDRFQAYCEQGKRAYEIASEIEPHSEKSINSSLLRRLSDQFDLCAYGLHEIRRQWECNDDQSNSSLVI